jgi:hypothetical protein
LELRADSTLRELAGGHNRVGPSRRCVVGELSIDALGATEEMRQVKVLHVEQGLDEG